MQVYSIHQKMGSKLEIKGLRKKQENETRNQRKENNREQTQNTHLRLTLYKKGRKRLQLVTITSAIYTLFTKELKTVENIHDILDNK